MKKLLILFLLLPMFAFAQPCADEDTVRANAATLITATTARINGTTDHMTGSVLSMQLKYVRVGLTDTITVSWAGTTALRNLTGLYANTQYYYYYKSICASGTMSQTIGAYTFTTLTATVVYAWERSTNFPYVRVDTGFTIPRLDTGSLYRAADIGGNLRFRPADSLPYYYNGDIWKLLAVDSAGIMPALNRKVDSVTVSSDSLWYWINGVSYGYILPTANNWSRTGNAGTVAGTNFLGTTDSVDLVIKTAGNEIGRFSGDGLYRVGLGYQNTPSGSWATSLGYENTASGAISIATGFRTNASGPSSFSMGNVTKSSGSYSLSMGHYTKSKHFAGTVIGAFNDSTNATSENSFSTTNRAFQIGIGQDDYTRANAMTVLFNGNTGIGTLTPDSLLTVEQGIWGKRGVRFSGLPTGVGTKSLRIDATGNLSIADTTISSLSGSGTTNYVPKWTSGTALGNSTITDDGTTETHTIKNVFSVAGAASTPAIHLTGTIFSGGTGTTTKPKLLIEPTGTTSTAWSTNGTGLGINAASGFTGNLIDAQLNGVSAFKVTGAGVATFAGAGTFAGTTVNNSITANGNVTVAGGANHFGWGSSSKITAATNGNITMSNTAVSDFGLLQLGGTTSSFPAIARNGTGIDIKLADNSAYTNLGIAGLRTAYVAKTADYTLTASDEIVKVTTAATTMTLPTAVSVSGKQYTIVNASSGNITIATTSSQNIGNYNVATTYTLASDGSLFLASDGAGWIIKSKF